MIVDACADFRNDFEFTAPGEELPVGAPRPAGQFALFAARPGEAASNLPVERRGQFSRELLLALEQQDAVDRAWPPAMEAVARRTQDAFRALRATGQTAQLPRFEWNDWDGDTVKASSLPQPGTGSPHSPSSRGLPPQPMCGPCKMARWLPPGVISSLMSILDLGPNLSAVRRALPMRGLRQIRYYGSGLAMRRWKSARRSSSGRFSATRFTPVSRSSSAKTHSMSTNSTPRCS